MAPQYFRNAVFSKDYPAEKATKEERVSTSKEEKVGRRAKCLQQSCRTSQVKGQKDK